MAPRPDMPPATPEPTSRRATPKPPRDLAPHVQNITRVGARYAVRSAPDRRTGLRVAAWAIRHNLVTATNAAGGTTARAYIRAVPAITGPLIDILLTRSAVDGETVVSSMPAPERTRLADALDATAAARPQG